MRYLALATDYDGTLARDGRASPEAVEGLRALRESGRRTVLVTGRQLDDLWDAFDELDVFDRVVAENGAVILDPATRRRRVLAARPPEAFAEGLRERGVEPLSVGEVVVATWEPHQMTVIEAIREMGLELQVIFNKGAVMVLPPSVNKATGLAAALEDLRLSPHNVVGVGDAENDHAFLELCDVGVAVANALPAVKEHADHVTDGDHGDGVREVIERLLADDLASIDEKVTRHDVIIGRTPDGEDLRVKPHRTNVLVAGPSGSGKSTFTASFLERLQEHVYQFCVIDPEGDHDAFERAIVLGSPESAPEDDEVVRSLSDGDTNVIVNLLGVDLEDRPGFFERLLPRIQMLRAETGRPHWLVVDEAHHMLPDHVAAGPLTMPKRLYSVLMITVHPERVSRAALEAVDVVVSTPKGFRDVFEAFAGRTGTDAPDLSATEPGDGQLVAWVVGRSVTVFEPERPRGSQRRHLRKYAEGDVQDKAFVFRGPDDRLNLRAQNLAIFVQMAEGVDDDTWLHHLHRGDYSAWFREAIKDDALADAAAEVERDRDASETRQRIRRAIDERYTLPA
jgi:HAD superfamily hydrolase (TIGR01484 family)